MKVILNNVTSLRFHQSHANRGWSAEFVVQAFLAARRYAQKAPKVDLALATASKDGSRNTNRLLAVEHERVGDTARRRGSKLNDDGTGIAAVDDVSW